MINLIKKQLKKVLMPKAKLIILNYHQLGKSFDPKLHNRDIWNSDTFFEEQMNYLKKNFKLVSIVDGLEALRSGSIKETLISISFDDGDASVSSLAMPILDRLGIPATFFINTAYGTEKVGYWYNLGPYFEDQELLATAPLIRNTSDPKEYRELLQKENASNLANENMTSPFYSDYKEFEECNNPLFHFGLHGHEHLRFSMLTAEEQKENLQKNMEQMKTWPNYVPLFAIPFGQPKDWNEKTIEISKELGLTPLLAFKGYNSSYRSPFLRHSVDGMDLRAVLEGFSPFQKTYDQLNNLSS